MTLTDTQLSNVFSVAAKYIDKKIPQIFELSTPMMKQVMANKQFIAGGNRLTWALNDKKMDNIGFITGTSADVIDTGTQRNLTNAELDWKYLTAGFSVTLDELNRTQDSPYAVKGLVEEKLRNTEGSLSEFIATALFASGSSDPNAYNGFLDIFADSGTAYAGLLDTDLDNDAAGDPVWLPQIDSTTNVVSYTNISPMITKLKTKKSTIVPGSTVDYMISNAEVLSKFKTTQQGQQRFYAAKDLQAGFDGINVDGVVWYADDHCQGSGAGSTDNFLYVINSKSMQMGYRYGFDGKSSPLDRKSYNMPNQPVMNYNKNITGNLMCLDRRVNGVFKALNPSA